MEYFVQTSCDCGDADNIVACKDCIIDKFGQHISKAIVKGVIEQVVENKFDLNLWLQIGKKLVQELRPNIKIIEVSKNENAE